MEIKRTPGNAAKGYDEILNGFTKVAKVGWVKKSAYPSGTPVAYVAAIQEFGSPVNNIPPRPFLRPTIAEKTQEWQVLFAKGAKAIIVGNETPHTVLEKIGAKAAGDVRRAISQITNPALAEKTILARINRNSKFSKIQRKFTVNEALNTTKPLIDTGIMLGTLTHTVEEE